MYFRGVRGDRQRARAGAVAVIVANGRACGLSGVSPAAGREDRFDEDVWHERTGGSHLRPPRGREKAASARQIGYGSGLTLRSEPACGRQWRRRACRLCVTTARVGTLFTLWWAWPNGLAAEELGTPASPVLAHRQMVVSQERQATRIGLSILEQGGNAVDAAVAVGLALAVTHPQAGNLGGGGFMVIARPDRNTLAAIDYREAAPLATTRDIFLTPQGDADPAKSLNSGLGVGVPGTVAGLTLALDKYGSGRFSLATLAAPAIRLAREGFAVDEDLADSLARLATRLQRWPSSAALFLRPSGTPLQQGDTLRQTDLAQSLDTIAREGSRAFYAGPIAEKIVTAVRAAGGVMTREDLRAYHAIERTPLSGSYRGYDIVAMPPPSSGGVHLLEMLNVLEGYPLAERGERSPQTLHLMIETMKRAYADRAQFLGDPDQVHIPLARLIAKSYAQELRAEIDPEHAKPAVAVGSEFPHEGDNTTHFSVIDAFGNAVANTYSLNLPYGLGLVADGTGILLNNELDDFAAKPGAPNAYGLLGGAANAPGPGKRPLSSMSPTIVMKDGRPFLITGSPGGSRIITTVLQVIVNVIDFHDNMSTAVDAPRVHDQWRPDAVFAEGGLPEDTVRALEAKGHTVRLGGKWGSANSIRVMPDAIEGAADPRSRGAAAEGD
jgi:gamma-glutamyltranspeptidase / glutathione hydrolase